MERRTVHYRRTAELDAFAARRGLTFSGAVNLLLGLALDNIVDPLEQLPIPGIISEKEERNA